MPTETKAKTPTKTEDTAPAAGSQGARYDVAQLKIPKGMPDAIVQEVLELAEEADASLAGVQKMLDKRATQPFVAPPRMTELHRPDAPMVRFIGSARVERRQVLLHPTVGPDGQVRYSLGVVERGDTFPWYATYKEDVLNADGEIVAKKGDMAPIPKDCVFLSAEQERLLGTAPSRAAVDRVLGPLESGTPKPPVLPTGPKKPKTPSPV